MSQDVGFASTSTGRRTMAADCAAEMVGTVVVVVVVVVFVVVTEWIQIVVVALAGERVALVAIDAAPIAVVPSVVAVAIGTAWWLAEQFAQTTVVVAWIPSGKHGSWSYGSRYREDMGVAS